MKKTALLILAVLLGTILYGFSQTVTNISSANVPVAQTSADNSAIGDVVMSVLDLAEFRKARGDRGPNFRWVLADGAPIQGDIPGMKIAPNFEGRYPRGFSKTPVPDMASGEDGRVGTTIGQSIQKHRHSTTWGTRGVNPNDGVPRAAVERDNDNHMVASSDETGGAETRPNSTIMYFYIKVRR